VAAGTAPFAAFAPSHAGAAGPASRAPVATTHAGAAVTAIITAFASRHAGAVGTAIIAPFATTHAGATGTAPLAPFTPSHAGAAVTAIITAFAPPHAGAERAALIAAIAPTHAGAAGTGPFAGPHAITSAAPAFVCSGLRVPASVAAAGVAHGLVITLISELAGHLVRVLIRTAGTGGLRRADPLGMRCRAKRAGQRQCDDCLSKHDGLPVIEKWQSQCAKSIPRMSATEL
jgi:hypothetical protein